MAPQSRKSGTSAVSARPSDPAVGGDERGGEGQGHTGDGCTLTFASSQKRLTNQKVAQTKQQPHKNQETTKKTKGTVMGRAWKNPFYASKGGVGNMCETRVVSFFW